MRKLPIVIIFFLVCSLIPPSQRVDAANEPYDHDELLEYEGYGQAMYETVVEETTFITGQYTKNKEFVSGSIDQIVDYSKFWKNEAKDFIAEDSLRDAIERGGGYLLTVGDWVKKLFGGYGDEYHPQVPDYGSYSQYVTFKPDTKNTYAINPGYVFVVGAQRFGPSDGYKNYSMGGSWSGDVENGTDKKGRLNADLEFYIGGLSVTKRKTFYDAIVYDFYHWNTNGDFGKTIWALNQFGVTAHFEKDDTSEPVVPDYKPDPYTDFKKYIDEKLDKMATPQPRPYLSCPNGTKIQMSISGSTFLGVDGKAMIVNKDGTASVDSAICKLGWDKPVVKYIDDRAAIETPDGKWQDVETGKNIDHVVVDDTEPKNPSCEELDEELEMDSGQCEGVPYFGKKLEYIFGNATGNKHNINRSIAMERQLNSIGIFDDAKGKKLVLDNLSDAFDDPSSILKTQDNGRVVRESILTGPNGVLKVESVWDKEKLISVKFGEDVGEKPEEGTGKVISDEDRAKLNNWTNIPDDDLYLKYKDVFDNPKYYNQDTGVINWPENNGFLNTPIDEILQPGFKIDRYGSDTGTFVSPEGTPSEMRAIAPGTDLQPYSVFEVVVPLEVKGGQIAPWFDEVGGGAQYKLPDTVRDLLKAGIIRRITP